MRQLAREDDERRTNIRVVLRSSSYFLIVCIVLHRFPLVHSVEVETGVVCLDGLEESSEGILEASQQRKRYIE